VPGEVVRRGVHGTSQERAKQIIDGGFNLGGGRRGKGVYFWSEGPNADRLARDWFRQACEAGNYRTETNPQAAIVRASITVDVTEFMDCKDPEIAAMLERASMSYAGRRVNNSDMSGFYEAFYLAYERKSHRKIKLIQTDVSPPGPSKDWYPVPLLGHPSCYVVRDRECIAIL